MVCGCLESFCACWKGSQHPAWWSVIMEANIQYVFFFYLFIFKWGGYLFAWMKMLCLPCPLCIFHYTMYFMYMWWILSPNVFKIKVLMRENLHLTLNRIVKIFLNLGHWCHQQMLRVPIIFLFVHTITRSYYLACFRTHYCATEWT